MKNNVSWGKALGAGGWAIIFLLIAFIITAIAAVGIENWDWNLLTDVFEDLWEVFVAVLVFFIIFVIFLYKYPLQTLSFGLSAMAVILIAAACRSSSFGETIRNYIDANYDFNYIATGAILAAILLTFVGIYRTQTAVSKVRTTKVETPEEEATGAEPAEEEVPLAELIKEEIRKAEPVKEEAPKAEVPREEVPAAEPVKEEAPKVETPPEIAPEPETPKEEAPAPETPKPDTYKGLTKKYDNLNLMDE
ncbi:MAG: hypothetical protein JW967_06265 [Dehalococcoidales bacterium]|nr:hypothetical protein [Dehalococcoidales bacterium]